MKNSIKFLTISISLLVFNNVNSQKVDDSELCACSKTGNSVEMKVKLEELYSDVDNKSNFIFRNIISSSKEKIKIDKNTSITLSLKNPNLFRYSFRFENKTELIESYNYLDGLLEKGFKLAGGGASSDPYLKLWETEITNVSNEYNKLLSTIPEEVFLTDTQSIDIGDSINDLIELIKEGSKLDEVKKNAKIYLDTLGIVSPIQLEYYRELKEKEKTTISEIKKTTGIYNRITNGVNHFVNQQKSGTVVTINITPEINSAIFLNESRNAPKSISIQYFVQSRFKVHFHTGISFSGIKEVSLEKINEGGTDAFKVVESDDSSTDLAAFLSVPLINLNEIGTSGVDFSLGTGYQDVGEKIFFGLSLRLGNIGSVTGGAVLNTKSVEVEGEANLGQVIDNFEIKSAFAGFFSISLNAF